MEKYKKGDVVTGVVTGIEDYGIFLLVDDNTTGLIHISEISDDFVKNVSDYATVGDKLSADVIEYDSLDNRLKLSIKNNKNIKKNKVVPIEETPSGFTNLGKELDKWIEDMNDELSNK